MVPRTAKRGLSRWLRGSIVVNPPERHTLHGRAGALEWLGSRLKGPGSQEGRLTEPGCAVKAGVMGTAF